MRRTVLTAVVAAFVGAVVAMPLAVYASHRFLDVPDSNVFHGDIQWLAEAGVTRGCNPPENTEFCPDDEVTRGQMAAFLKRFATYLGAEDGTPGEAGNADTLDGLDSEDLLPDCSPGYVFATAEIDVSAASATEFTTAGVVRSYTCNGEDLLVRASNARVQVVVDDGDDTDDTIGVDAGRTIGMAVSRTSVSHAAASGVNQCAGAPPPFVLCWTFDFRDDDAAVPPNGPVYVTVNSTG